MADLWNDPLPPLLSHRPTSKLARWANCAKIAWTKLQSLPPPVKGAFWLTLLVLVLMLTACATTSLPSSEPARIPSPPPTRLSESSPDYLQLARTTISEWRKRLQELTAKPAN